MPQRRLINEEAVRQASREGLTRLSVTSESIVTPAARDAARLLGIALDTAAEAEPGQEAACDCAHSPRRIAIGSDHGGFAFKQDLVPFLTEMSVEVIDVGTHSEASCDYPDFAYAVAFAVAVGEADYGIMIDGAGPGSAIACNKVVGIRAACVHDEFTAWNARAHNNANIITLGSRAIGIEVCRRLIKTFLKTAFEGGRHERRVEKIAEIEHKSFRRNSA